MSKDADLKTDSDTIPRLQADTIHRLDKATRVIEDFPIVGVRFRDVSPILEHAELFSLALVELVRDLNIDAIDAFVGIESRGFILAAALAAKFEKGFVPLRKAGKLPPPVLAETYALEYGHATLEVRAPQTSHAQERPMRVVLIDDVLATGGTLQAALKLCEAAKFDVQDLRVLIDIQALNQFRFRGQPIHAVLRY